MYNGETVNRIARLETEGSLDSGFDIGTGFSDAVHTIITQEDGDILIGGDFTSYKTEGVNRIARLDATGTLDGVFNTNTGTGFGSTVLSIKIQEDGKIVAGGDFTSFDGAEGSHNHIARIENDGSVDLGFDIGSGFNNTVYDIAIQGDGNILAVGDFISYKAEGVNRIARLDATGTLDSGFDIGGGFNGTARTVAIQEDGKIVVGGDFILYNSEEVNRIARLDATGTLDGDFDIGEGFNGAVRSIAIQSDGKIVAGGDFTSFNGVEANRIVRLNTDGSIDSNFNTNGGFNEIVRNIAIQDDGKIIMVGDFLLYDNKEANRIARLISRLIPSASRRSSSRPFYSVVFLSSPSEGGEVPLGGKYRERTSFSINASPNDGYVFVHWEEDEDVLSEYSIYSFIVNEPRELIAVFDEEITDLKPDEEDENIRKLRSLMTELVFLLEARIEELKSQIEH